MSYLYDALEKRPQPWIYVFFIVMMILVFWIIFSFGLRKADRLGVSELNNNTIFEDDGSN